MGRLLRLTLPLQSAPSSYGLPCQVAGVLSAQDYPKHVGQETRPVACHGLPGTAEGLRYRQGQIKLDQSMRAWASLARSDVAPQFLSQPFESLSQLADVGKIQEKGYPQ